MIADYFVVRRRQLNVGALYDGKGQYRYTNGISLVAVTAFVLAVLPNLAGFSGTIKAIPATLAAAPLVCVYDYPWLVAFTVAFFIYLTFGMVGGTKTGRGQEKDNFRKEPPA